MRVPYKKRLTVHRIYFLMIAVVVLKTLNLLCKAEDKWYIQRTGGAHGRDVFFYTFSFLRGVTLFTLILLVGTGWSFVKPYLQDKEKKVLMIVIPLQVVARIARVAIEESGPYGADGKAAVNLIKLALFRYSYVLYVLGLATSNIRYLLTTVVAGELATLAFSVYTKRSKRRKQL